MPGASLKNAVKSITHKERGQLGSRLKKFGLLEKHKDYKERSNDFHKKADHLKNLRKKAAERNPDEFYYHMYKSKVKDGKHKEIQDGSIDTDIVKLMKTQDMGYINHKKSIDDNKIRKIKNSLHLIGDKKPRKHKIFVESSKELKTFDPVKHFETAPELIDRTYNRIKLSTIENNTLPSAEHMKSALKKRNQSYKELEGRQKRASKLNEAAERLILQRNLMGKGNKRKVKGQYKWKRERKT